MTLAQLVIFKSNIVNSSFLKNSISTPNRIPNHDLKQKSQTTREKNSYCELILPANSISVFPVLQS